MRSLLRVLVLLCVMTSRGAAQDVGRGQELTLRAAAEAALAQHPSLSLGAAHVARADAGVREVSASLLPAVSVDALMTRFQEPMVVAPLHGFDARNPPVFDELLAQAGVTVGYTLFDGGSRGANVTRAGLAAQSARAAVEAARQTVLVEVTRHYTGTLLARELVAAHGARVASLEQERARAVRLLEEGKAARVILLRADAALSAARAELAAAEVQVENAARELARTMGVSAADVAGRRLADVRARSVTVDRDSALTTALRENADAARMRLQVDAADAARAEARAQWWPRVQLGARYARYASGAGDAGGEWQTGAQLSYVVFNAGARPAQNERARAEVQAAEAERAITALRIGAQVDGALAAVRAAQARASAWTAAITQYEEVARIEKLALDAGAGLQTDYLSAEAELLRARAAGAEARYSELTARTELARAMGVLSLDWLTRNVETVP